MLGALVSLAQSHLTSRFFGAPGKQFFSGMLKLDGVAVFLVCCSYFAAAISEEKDEMTLGLLKMAGISPLALILGKGLPRFMHVVIPIAIQFPFVLLAVTMGGITTTQIVAGFATLLSLAWLGFGIALFASVLAKTSKSATLLTFFLLSSVLWASWIFMVVATWFFFVTDQNPGLTHTVIVDFLTSVSVFQRFETILSTGYAGGTWHLQQLIFFVVGLLGLIAARAVFEPATRNLVAVAPVRRRASRKRTTLLRPSRPWKLALAWKDFYFQRGGRSGMLGRILGIPFVIAFVLMTSVVAMNNALDAAIVTGILLLVSAGIFVLDVVLIAGSFLKTEIRNNTWSSLYLLPMTVTELVGVKLLGNLACLIPSAAWFFIGLGLSPEVAQTVAKLLQGVGNIPFIVVLVGLQILLAIVLYLSLTTYLSLTLRFGAAVLAYFIMSFGASFLAILFALLADISDSEYVLVFCSNGITLTLIGFFWVATHHKLTDLARK